MSKVIAIMDKPISCRICPFSVCKWSCPPWSKEKANTQGHFCTLIGINEREIFITEYGDNSSIWKKCPLKPYKEE